MTGFLTQEDLEWWSDLENQFIFNFNLLWTSGAYWERTPENVKIRENKLRELYKSTKMSISDRLEKQVIKADSQTELLAEIAKHFEDHIFAYESTKDVCNKIKSIIPRKYKSDIERESTEKMEQKEIEKIEKYKKWVEFLETIQLRIMQTDIERLEDKLFPDDSKQSL